METNKKCSCKDCSTNTGYRITTNGIPGTYTTSPRYDPITRPDYTPITRPDYTPITISPPPAEIKGNVFIPFYTIDDGAWYMVVTSIRCRDCNTVEKTTHYVRKDFEGTLTHICPKCNSHRVDELSRQYYPRVVSGSATTSGYTTELDWPSVAKDIVTVEMECELCKEKSKHNVEIDKSSAAANDGRMYTYTCGKCGRLNHEIIRNTAPHVAPRAKAEPKAESKPTVEVNTKFGLTESSYKYTCKECSQKFKLPKPGRFCPYCGGRASLDGISMTFNLCNQSV